MNLPIRPKPSVTNRTEETMYGVSQIGIHDLVPQLGYREYWYPAIEVRKLGRKPKRVKMLGGGGKCMVLRIVWSKTGP